MIYSDLVYEKGYHIAFEQICEPRNAGIKLRINVNKSKNPTDLLIHPHPDSKAISLQLDFLNYVTYSVIYDDFTIWDDSEIYQGECFRIYSKSQVLESIPKQYDTQKKLKHFSLSCIEHKVDILSFDEPIITEISSNERYFYWELACILYL
ncbi:hypothetical protein [Oceanobacillus massiliensis]|uniref:hypothetical protein n=2 Tax=Oceanobacillus massiliensis TaxID=1465765 RepID=UPI00301B144A